MKLRELVLGGEVEVGERKVADAGKKGFVPAEAKRADPTLMLLGGS